MPTASFAAMVPSKPMGNNESNAEFWARVWAALQRVIALALFVLAHWGLSLLFRLAAPPNLKRAFLLGEDILFVMFMIVYLYLAWGMIAAFMPGLTPAYDVRDEEPPS
jgi:hypothetical protein